MTVPNVPQAGASAGRRGLLPLWPAVLAVALGFLVAPWVCYYGDTLMSNNWAAATGGSRPWDAYRFGMLCVYPPFVLYALTLTQSLRLLLHAPDWGPVMITLIKLPNLLAYAAGIPLCLYGLRAPFGEAAARRAALAYGLCLPLWFDAAVWAQWDALLALGLVAAAVALLNGRPVWAGAALGWALSVKLQAIVAFPVLVVFLWRRFGARGLLGAAGAGLAVWGLLALPFLLHGTGGYIHTAYFGAVGYFPVRTMSAWNGWHLLNVYDIHLRHMTGEWVVSDARRVGGLITFKQIGLLLLGAYQVFLMASVWRRPTRETLLWAAALSVFAFFMLPTQIHSRYLLPGVALLTLLLPLSRRAWRLYLALSVTVLLNEVLLFDTRLGGPAMRAWDRVDAVAHHMADGVIVALVNVALFLWATWAFRRETSSPPGAPTDTLAPASAPLPRPQSA